MTEIPLLVGLEPIADRYDGFLIDLWGVLHDGERAYPDVVDCLEHLRGAGKRIGLLSNAPRRVASVVAKLDGLGIGPELYDFLITSGEATRSALIEPPDPWHATLGSACFHIGPDRDRCLFEGVPGLRLAGTPETADFVVNTGPDRYEETLDDYAPVLGRCAALNLPMVCANPDLTVMVGERMVICAGTLADHYEALGGSVRYHGKPYPSVYDLCLARMAIDDRSRVLAIGDSLRTDIAGANATGLDGALAVGGIHAVALGIVWGELPDPARLNALVAAGGHRPRVALASLRWRDGRSGSGS